MVSALDRKLGRDLWRIKGQAAAIALVIAAGVMSLVTMTGLVSTLEETRSAYYDRYRLAEVFVPAARAPGTVADRLADIPGVAVVETRVTGLGTLDLPDLTRPLPARFLSLPPSGQPALNAVVLTGGRMPDPTAESEALLLDGFAKARGIAPGDRLSVTLAGVKRQVRIVGRAMAPEFVFSTAPGEMVPDDGRFAVLWMGRAPLAAALDLDGAFNEALLTLARDADPRDVIGAVDRLMDPWGGQGAYGLADLPSNRFVTEEITGLRGSAVMVPPVFLAVAVFLLYVVIARMVQAEREQIGLLKAFGYTSAEVSAHYAKLVIVIAVLGALVGIALGAVSGRSMAGLYQQYYKFPFLVFRLEPATFALGIGVAVAAALAAAALVLRRLFALTPAVAMRPPAPADYSGLAGRAARLMAWLDQPARMVLRRVLRQPGRMAASVAGIAAGMALAGGMLTVMDGFTRAVVLNFEVIDRSDMAVSFTRPVSGQALYELAHLPGVLAVEPQRSAPVRFEAGRASYRGAVTGLDHGAVLNRAVGTGMETLDPPEGGILLSRPLARILNAVPGDTVTLTLLDGDRRTLRVPVAGVADTLMGAPAFMEIGALNRALGTPGQVNGALLRVDPLSEESVQAALKDRPGVAGVSVKAEARAAFQTMLDSGAGATRYSMMILAAVIAFGIVYSTARIALSERSRDLASLRVLGFTGGETAFVLLGELALVVLVALPLGALGGALLASAIAAGFSTDIYQIPATPSPASLGFAALAVVMPALVSGVLVRIDLARLDLVSALKTRE